MPGQADGIPPRTCWPGSPAYMKMKRSVLRSLEVIGEASKNLSPVGGQGMVSRHSLEQYGEDAGQTDPRLLQRQVGDRP